MFLQELLTALQDFIFAPFREPSLLWQLAPILVLWVVLGLYFGYHKKEELGWNTSLGNGITLFWIGVGSLQHIFSEDMMHFTWAKVILLFVVILYSGFIIYTSFKHFLPSKITYTIASHHVVYFLSVVSLLFAYDMIYFTLPMIIAMLVIFGFALLFFYLLRLMLPEMPEEENQQAQPSTFDSYQDSSSLQVSDDDPYDFGEPGGVEHKLASPDLSDSDVKF